MIMEAMFFEIILKVPDMLASGFESRDEVEDPLNDALEQSGMGEISGGGTGMGVVNIDVDINTAISADEAIKFLRTTLRTLNAPRSTIIIRHKPERCEYIVWES